MHITSLPLRAFLFIQLVIFGFVVEQFASGQSTVSGTVPLPEAPPASVMAKRYEIVSKGGVLATTPPLAVVWIEGVFPNKVTDTYAEVTQKDFMFHPTVLPIQVGTTVAFPNHDKEYHNVFSYSRAKRFDLGRYMPEEKPVPTQVFDQPGSIVLRCDVHEHMRAIILVLDSPYFVKTDSTGNFSIEDVPTGEYTLKAWIDSKTTLETPIRVDGFNNIEINF